MKKEKAIELYKKARGLIFKEVKESEEFDEEDREFLFKFLEQNATDVLPVIVKKEEYDVSWRLVFTHETCSNPSDLGFFFLTPKQLDIWKKIFLLEDDITEYTAALRLVDSWSNWEYMKENNTHFFNQVEHWKKELDVKRRSASEQMIVEMASEGNFNANKYICTKEGLSLSGNIPGQTSEQIVGDVTRLKEIGLLG